MIYHGCGNVNRIFEDFIEIGVDAYNPLEAKAGLDVVNLHRRFGHRIGFCGNMDVGVWANGTRNEIERAVLTKLNAAKGGGFLFQSDHSVPGNISGENYDYVVRLVRERGEYPLRLGEYDIPRPGLMAAEGPPDARRDAFGAANNERLQTLNESARTFSRPAMNSAQNRNP